MSDAFFGKIEGATVFYGQLVKDGMLSAAEASKMLEKKKSFEHVLTRRTLLIEHAWGYIDWEMLLWQKLTEYDGNMKIKKKHMHAQAKIILNVYERLARKFASDVGFWSRYAAFAIKSGLFTVVSKVFAKAMQLHPQKVSLKIEAAQWEYFVRRNITAARTLFMATLRVEPASHDAWSKYLAVEVDYARSIKQRQDVLGIDLANGNVGDDSISTINQIVAGAIPCIILKNAKNDVQDSDYELLLTQASLESSDLPLLTAFISSSINK